MATDVLLWGAPGPWPFRGAFRGTRITAGARLSWAGRVGQTAPLDVAFRMARAVDAALHQPQASERRRLLASAWDAVGGVDLLTYSDSLSLLLTAQDEDGTSVAAVGLGALWAADGESVTQPWLPDGHPMLGPPGVPTERPGALSVPVPPPIFVGVCDGESPGALPVPREPLMRGAGVWS